MVHKLLEHEEMGMKRIQEGCCFSERGTGVCLGATRRNGNLENRDREDQERLDQDGRRIGGDRDQDQDRERDRKCQCAKLGVESKGFLKVFQLRVADWQNPNLYMRALATRFP